MNKYAAFYTSSMGLFFKKECQRDHHEIIFESHHFETK